MWPTMERLLGGMIILLAMTAFAYGINNPTNLTATAVSANEIDLAWRDRSSNETSFRLWRALPGGAFAILAEVPANATTYKDLSVAPATTYRYQIEALIQSAFSAAASATTLAAGGGGDGGGAAYTPSGPLVIDSQNDKTIKGLKITSTSGPCILIKNASNITIKQNEIGPCGSDASTAESMAIKVQGSTGINIWDNYLHVDTWSSDCKNSHDTVYLIDSGVIDIEGNVIAYGEKNVLGWHVSNVTMNGNFLLNPRGSSACANPDNKAGHQAQFWADADAPNSNITANNNYLISSTDTGKYPFPGNVSDGISFGATNGATAIGNFVTGGYYDKACGVIVDAGGSDADIENNVIWDTYNCGIGLGSAGSRQKAIGNKILITNPPATTGHAGGLVVTNYYSTPCSNISINNNIAYAKQSNGYVQGYYDQGVCTGVSLSGNIFDSGSQHAAYDMLYPMTKTNPPPLIPPGPHDCVARSPYSTQTSKPGC